MKMNKIYTPFIVLLLVACQADDVQLDAQQSSSTLSITTSVQQFEGAANTRADNDATLGDANFVAGEKIKIKIVCPVSDRIELGEDTYSGSFDGFYLLKWQADTLATLTTDDGYDINGDYSASNSPDIYSRYLAQPTPYVFTAQSWSEEQVFIAGSTTEKRVEQYSNVFHANQSLLANYRASDLIWAQTVMQTGSYNVHLSFKHVMAVLLITIDGTITDDAVLTVTNMPDINQAEVIVGDYFASKSQVNASGSGYDCSYKTKSSITNEADNGKALGIAVVNDNAQTIKRVAFADINQSATYTAYRVAGTNTFRLIVPPCTIKNATIWLRTGNNLQNRYSMPLNSGSSFTPVAGTRYHLTMTI